MSKKIDDYVGDYINLRDRVDAIKRQHQEEVAPYREAMMKLENMFLEHLLSTGAKNVKTPHGTIYQSEQTSVKVADWSAILEFVKDQELWHMLEKRVSKQAVADFLSETGNLPPGLDVTKAVVCNIRRS